VINEELIEFKVIEFALIIVSFMIAIIGGANYLM
jgi:hypothetical protein